MSEENISQEFRLKNVDETRNYWIEEINQKKLMSNKHNIEHLLILISTVTTAQKMKFSINDFFSKCDQICSFQRILLHLLKKSSTENFNPMTHSQQNNKTVLATAAYSKVCTSVRSQRQ